MFHTRPQIFFSKSKWNAILDGIKKVNLSNKYNIENISSKFGEVLELLRDENTLVVEGIEQTIKLEQAQNIAQFFEIMGEERKTCYIFQFNNSTLSFQNALLKIIEERDDVSFVLTATTKSQVLPTIISRCIEHNDKVRTSRDQNIISVAANYGIVIEKQEILEIRKKIDSESFIFISSKRKNDEIFKWIVVWQDMLLKNIVLVKDKDKVRQISRSLSIVDRTLNLYGTKFYSKKAAIADFYSDLASLNLQN